MIKINLRVLMAIHNINITDIHEATGLSRTTISNLKHGYATGISFYTLSKLCNFFNCDVGELLTASNK